MEVIVLCAGYATRLYPLTENCPKPLLPLADKPILDYILEKVVKFKEVSRIHIITNNKFASHFEEWKKKSKLPKPLFVINDGTTSDADKLGAIGDLAFTIQQQKIRTETLVIAGDNLFDFELDGFLKFAKTCGSVALVGACDVGDRELAKKYGILALAKDGKVTSFVEKPKDPPSTFASMAIYYFTPKSVALIDDYLKAGLNKDQPGHYIRWLAETQGIHGYVFKGHWFDIGDIHSYQHADQFYRNRSSHNA